MTASREIRSNLWTDERIALLHKLNHLSRSQIATEINRETYSAFTRNAIIGKMGRLGIVAIVAPRENQEHKVKRIRIRYPAKPKTPQPYKTSTFRDGPPSSFAEAHPSDRPLPGDYVRSPKPASRIRFDMPDGKEPLNIPYAEATDRQCGFICSDERMAQTVCGHPVVMGSGAASWRPASPYCAHHHGLSHMGYRKERAA